MSENEQRLLGIDQMKYDANGLIPAVIQDASSGDVLMVANAKQGTLLFLPLSGAVLGELAMPDQQNYPNPCNPSTTIRYGLPERSHARLGGYNMLGQQIARLVNGEIEAGYHEVNFDASNLASGVYLYRLNAADYVQTRRLVVLR